MSLAGPAHEEDSETIGRLFGRPKFQLESLPIKMRWEVTRRHPYYDIWWKRAADAYKRRRGELPDDDFDRLLEDFALHSLSAIGVASQPPDPATEFAELGADVLDSAWLSGAVQPMTVRGIAAMLIDGCSDNTLMYLGATLFEASKSDTPGQLSRRQQSQLDLMLADVSGLNQHFDGAFVTINPAASARDISKAIDELLSKWKQKYSLTERRNRSEKHSEYLSIWDMREGWSKGVYDRNKELTFLDIGKRNKKSSVSSISKKYRRAFELITGHSYSPELWYRFFAPIKLIGLTSGDRGNVSDRRPTKSRSHREVPAAAVRHNDDDSKSDDITSSRQAPSSDEGVNELGTDIRGLIKKGHSNSQIVKALELSDASLELVEYLRHRADF